MAVWKTNETPQFESVSGAAAASVVDSSTVPAGKVWKVLEASLQHDDTVNLSIQLLRSNPAADDFVGLTSVESVPASTRVPLTRSVTLRAGEKLRGFSETNPAAGQILIIKLYYLEIDVG